MEDTYDKVKEILDSVWHREMSADEGMDELTDIVDLSAQWQDISTAPKDRSVMLCCFNTHLPVYCGKYRYGLLGEPQQSVCAWRCDSSGRFANPTHWMPLPQPPNL